jgi:hypothetical protein
MFSPENPINCYSASPKVSNICFISLLLLTYFGSAVDLTVSILRSSRAAWFRSDGAENGSSVRLVENTINLSEGKNKEVAA